MCCCHPSLDICAFDTRDGVHVIQLRNLTARSEGSEVHPVLNMNWSVDGKILYVFSESGELWTYLLPEAP